MTDLNVDLWLDRINAEVTDAQGLRVVQGIADLALIVGEKRVVDPVTPGVYVIPYEENAISENTNSTGFHQPVRETVGVMSSIANRRDRTGRAAHNDLRGLRRALKDALLDWHPYADADPVEFFRGLLHNFDEGVILWLDLYRTAYHENT